MRPARTRDRIPTPMLAAMIGCLALLLGCARPAPPELVFAPVAQAEATATETAAAPVESTATRAPAALVQASATHTSVKPTAARPATPTSQSPGAIGDPILFFTGDLVSGSSVSRAQKVVALIQKLMASHAGSKTLVASTGDNEQENSPTLADYQKYFGATYGVFVSEGIFRPVRGNHDVQDAGHGAAYAQYFGPNVKLNYSYDLGDWHIVGLDQLNGTVNPTALEFLKSDLAAHASTTCQLVYWHVPTYSSGIAHGDATGLKPLNQVEYDAGVDIQINGHDHDYQRFYPLDPNGKRDDAKGITTFIDGIGGEDGRTNSRTSIAQAASALYLDRFPGGDGGHAIGVIMFTLHPRSADWALYDANDGTRLEHGTVDCH